MGSQPQTGLAPQDSSKDEGEKNSHFYPHVCPYHIYTLSSIHLSSHHHVDGSYMHTQTSNEEYSQN